MTEVHFGELASVDLRRAWPNEARSFTPWLADNLDKLAEVIGIPLDLESREVDVGRFAADLLARNPQDGSLVLIENQLEGSDHSHLGQILTYLAGLEAKTIIWIAREFDDAHRSAVNWLNEHTTDPFAFFAVRVKVVQIGDSPLAPVFEIVEQPNEWDRRIHAVSRESSELSELGLFRREFWEYFSRQYHDDQLRLPQNYADSVVWHEVPGADLIVAQYLAQKSVGVFVRGRRGESSEDVFWRLKRQETSIRNDLGTEIGEHPNVNGHYCGDRIAINSRDRGNWKRMTEWLHEACRVRVELLKSSTEEA